MDPDLVEDASELLCDLVAIPSPSKNEREAAERLCSFLRSYDRAPWIDDVGNVRCPGNDAVLLTSHIDTVTGALPVRITEEDGERTLWGRGVVDATGALCAMAAVAIDSGTSFVGVVDEEGDSTGATHLIDERDPPAAVINGEPSGWDTIALGYRGSERGTYTARTARHHSSIPEATAIDHVCEWVSSTATTTAATTPRSTTSIHATTIDGGASDEGNAIEATVDLTVRVPPGEDSETVRTTVEESIDVGSIEWTQSIPSFEADPRSTVATAIRGAIRATGGTPTHVFKGGTCDANLFADAWSCPIVTYGPGDATLDHTVEERLSFLEFERSIDVLELASATLVGRAATA